MYVKGVGMTKFGASTKSSHELAYEAACEALEDANMTMDQIDAIYCTSLEYTTNGERQRHFGSLLSSLFRCRKPIIKILGACGSGGATFWTALRSGNENILVVGGEKLMANPSSTTTDEFLMGAENRWEQPEGVVFPAQNALAAQEHMLKYGTTGDDLALIAYKNHLNAALNPKARFYNKTVTLDDIKKSPIVCSPLRLMDCSVSVDGGAAVVITTKKTDVKVIGSSLYCDYLPICFERETAATWDATILSSQEAYKQAGLTPKDIDVAELHDAFTIVELIAYEDLGFCKKGEGGKFIRSGKPLLEGELPINPSGGLKAKGHPVSTTGIAQIYETTKQLRGECEARQVQNAKIGLAHNIGGAGSTATCHILKKV